MSSPSPWIAGLGMTISSVIALFWTSVGCLEGYGILFPDHCGDWSGVADIVAVAFIVIGVIFALALVALAFTQPRGRLSSSPPVEVFWRKLDRNEADERRGMKITLIAPTLVVLFFIGIARAADPPPVKEGLWSTHMQMSQNPGGSKNDMTSTICRSHAFDEYVWNKGKNSPGCNMISSTLADHTWSVEMRCSINGSVMDIKSVATGDVDSQIHSETHTVMTPPLNGIAESINITDSKYLGSCPPGLQPGDRTLPNGGVVHGWVH